MKAHISTADLDPKDRLPYWSEVISRTYAQVEPSRLSERPFHGDVTSSDMGGVVVTNIGSEAMLYNRDGRSVRSDGCDHFFIGYTVSGSAGIVQDGRISKQKPGDIVVYSSGRPYTNHFPERYNQVVLIVPRPQIVARIPDVDRLTSTTLQCATPAGRMARRMFEELGACDDTLSADAGRDLTSSVLDVLSLALRVELLGSGCGSTGRDDRLARIKRYLLDRLEAPSLSVDRIARDNAVSVRTLHRLFAAEGGSVLNWLYDQRLNAGYRALAEGRIRHVTEAATTFGFADASHFAKAFRKAFGRPPSALLRAVSDMKANPSSAVA